MNESGVKNEGSNKRETKNESGKEWKREDTVEIAEGWNTYDPLGEVFFFAAGPFLKHSVFLAPAFAFGCGFF